MRILGIDPALTITGYGVIDIDKEKISVVEAGVIKTTPRQLLSYRLNKIHLAITGLISETKPNVMVLEKLFTHYHHPTTAYVLGHARGVICVTSKQLNVPLAEYSATRIKKAITGEGLASKYQIQRMVAGLLKLDALPKYTDVTDALALAIAHFHIIKFKL